MPIKIVLEDTDLNRQISAIAKSVSDLSPAMKQTGEYLVAQTKNRFVHTETAPDGKKWQPLSQRYLTSRAKKRNPNRILVLSRGLYESVHHVADKRSVTVGPNKVYAAVHQYGFKGTVSVNAFTRNGHAVKAHTRNVNIPARPYIGLSTQDYEQIPAIFTKFIEKQSKTK